MRKVAAGTDSQDAALQSDGPLVFVPGDPGIPRGFPLVILHSASFAKYAPEEIPLGDAVAFFRMSRSILTRASSALSRARSICSALTGLAPAPVSLPWADSRNQLSNVGVGMPSTFAVTALA